MPDQLKKQIPPRFVFAQEDPLPNYVWCIDTKTGQAAHVSLCNLSNFTQALWFAGLMLAKK